MQVSSNFNNYQPKFKGHIVVDINNLQVGLKSQLMDEFKKKIGHGIVEKTFSSNGQIVKNDIFIGFITENFKKDNAEDISQIIIYTGNDSKMPRSQINDKINQIDNIILKKAQAILKKFKISNKQNNLNWDISPDSVSGGFEVKGNILEARTFDEKSTIVYLDGFVKDIDGEFKHDYTDPALNSLF